MKKNFFLISIAASSLFLMVACTGKPEDTVTKFAAAVNANKAEEAGKYISPAAQQYDNLRNNNWSGLQSLINNWRNAGKMSFTDLKASGSGDEILLNGSYVSDLGTKAALFKMVKESDFLFLFYSYKIKEWKYDENSNGDASDDGFQINKFLF
jgi:hypothetical protein